MLAARSGLSPVMVGRAGPLGRLLSVAAGDGAEGRPAVALVTGEAGVGKTRLLQELIAGVPAGTVVLTGSAEPGSLGRPYDLVAGMLPDGLPPPGNDPTRAAVDALLARMGDGRALVVFEDLHWADSESVTVFERLAGSAASNALLVGTARADELSRRAPGGEMLERLERRQFVHHVHLERLTRVEVGAFLATVYGRVPPSGTVDVLHGRTGGNPFFLEEILNVAGEVDPAEIGAQPLPWSLAELVRAQLEGLSNDDRRLVEAAAILGRRAQFDLLGTMTRATEDELITRLRSLVDRGLLIEEAEDQFSFRHALVREAVERQLLGRERRRLHETALAALRESGSDDLADLARHAAGAGRYDEMVELARDGVQHYLRLGSSYQALRLADEALAEAPDDDVLLAGGARAAWLLGLDDEALAHAEHWYGVAARSGSLPERSAACRLLGRVYHELGRWADMWRIVAEVTELIDALPAGHDRAGAMAFLAQVHMLHDRTDPAIDWADHAIAEADAVDAKPIRAQAMVERGSALMAVPGREPEGVATLREAVAEAEAAHDWVAAARGLNNMCQSIDFGSPEGHAIVERMRVAAERAGFDAMSLRSYRVRMAEWAIIQGDLADCRRWLEAVAELQASGVARNWNNELNAFVAVEQGRFAEAERILDGLEPALTGNDDRWLSMLQLNLAALRGDRAAAARWLKRFTEAPEGPSYRKDFEIVFSQLEGLDRIGLVAEWAPSVLAVWRTDYLPPPHLDQAAAAVVAALGDDHADAVAALAECLADERVALAAYQRSWLGVLLARSLVALGRRAEALEAATDARRLLDRWPGWRRDEIDTLLQRLSGGPGGGVSDAASELTAREREVAGLLAEGVTNAELARRLFISPKTAAVHVSNILTKLGMSSRAEVAAWAVRSGLAGEGKARASAPSRD